MFFLKSFFASIFSVLGIICRASCMLGKPTYYITKPYPEPKYHYFHSFPPFLPWNLHYWFFNIFIFALYFFLVLFSSDLVIRYFCWLPFFSPSVPPFLPLPLPCSSPSFLPLFLPLSLKFLAFPPILEMPLTSQPFIPLAWISSPQSLLAILSFLFFALFTADFADFCHSYKELPSFLRRH